MNVNVVNAGYEIEISAFSFDPADATTYYFGHALEPPQTSAQLYKLPVWRTGTITNAYVRTGCYTSYSSAETSALSVRVNDTTDSSIVAALSTAAFNIQRVSGLSISVTEGDYCEMKIVTPTWVTNPVGAIFSVRLYVRVP